MLLIQEQIVHNLFVCTFTQYYRVYVPNIFHKTRKPRKIPRQTQSYHRRYLVEMVNHNSNDIPLIGKSCSIADQFSAVSWRERATYIWSYVTYQLNDGGVTMYPQPLILILVFRKRGYNEIVSNISSDRIQVPFSAARYVVSSIPLQEAHKKNTENNTK